jgi:hypothetical protein
MIQLRASTFRYAFPLLALSALAACGNETNTPGGGFVTPDAAPGTADAAPGAPDADPNAPDADPSAPDAMPPPPTPDAAPGTPDGSTPPTPDGGTTNQCEILDMAPAAACALTQTATVTACSIDPTTHTPSQTGYMDVTRLDGSHGFLCATQWTATGGFYFDGDRLHLHTSSSGCCGGATSATTAAVTDATLGTLHGPTHIKPQEMLAASGGAVRQHPFAVIVSRASAAAEYQAQLANWSAWAGDHQTHPAPDGSGSYYVQAPLAVDYVVIPTRNGPPIIVIGPEVSRDPDFNEPIGHPALGACDGQGGTPMAYIAGTIHGTIVTNASGRFGHESTVTTQTLSAVKKLFNCYGITVTGVEFSN